MSEINPVETIAEIIGGVDYDYEQRDQARRIVTAIHISLALRRALWLALTADNPLNRLSKAPSSPVETTDGSARPIPPDTLNGLTGAAYSDVIRREVEEVDRLSVYFKAIWHVHCTLSKGPMMRIAEAVMVLADAEIAALTDEVARFDRERQGFKAAIAQRDATIERMAADLLANDPKFGFDKTAALSEPDEETS